MFFFFFVNRRFSWTTGPCTATSSSHSYRRGLCWIQSIWALQGSAAGEARHWSATTYCQWISGKADLRMSNSHTNGLTVAKRCHCKCVVCHIHNLFPHILIRAQLVVCRVLCKRKFPEIVKTDIKMIKIHSQTLKPCFVLVGTLMAWRC